MAVQALGYLGISTDKLDEWSDFATRQIGLQMVDKTASSRAFRMDDRRQRIIVDKERSVSERFFGWEVAEPRASKGDECDRELPHGSPRNVPA